jgi:hypothetical protein
LAVLVLAVLLAAGPAQAGDRADLFGRGWISTAVLEDGERLPLFEGAKIRVDFDHGADHDAISWKADCNYFGAKVDVTEERLLIGQGLQTTQGCPKPRHRRDRWMNRFFSSDPKWRIRQDARLKLTAGDRVIRLHRVTSQRRDR